MSFEVIVEKRALADIQQAIDYYNIQQKGLGKKFEKELDINFERLEKLPYFQRRYGNVRCLPLKKFPFMIHFTVDENLYKIAIHAILHTSLNPVKWP
ncbi:MAG: type II toxin-antitoxin system RelE/ParE family toxin [Bacteroidia bacterium]|nr:type II toxin-antitoxin system RelE/ParE family toxin [Bacteroidia bacterium]